MIGRDRREKGSENRARLLRGKKKMRDYGKMGVISQFLHSSEIHSKKL